MTAVEYEKVRLQFRVWWLMSAVVAAVSWIVYRGFFARVQLPAGADQVLLMVLPSFGLIALAVWISYKLEKRFEHRHPEMENLEDWCRLFGSKENYPLTFQERSKAEAVVWTSLEHHARATAAKMAALDRIRELVDTYLTGSIERAELAPIEVCVRDAAYKSLRNHSERWDFGIEKMKFSPSSDARRYHESFLKRI